MTVKEPLIIGFSSSGFLTFTAYDIFPTPRFRFKNRAASDCDPVCGQSDLGARLAYTFNSDHWSLIYG